MIRVKFVGGDIRRQGCFLTWYVGFVIMPAIGVSRTMIKLTQEQEATVRKWVDDGSGLSDVQKNLLSQLGISATYMDVRFLAIDLGLKIREKRSEPAAKVAPPAGADAVGAGVPGDDLDGADAGLPPGMPGGVVVELDHVMKAGSVVSGTVKFSDGVSASWHLDQMGRLALSAGQPGYSPSQADIHAFQQELRKQLEKRGF